MPDGDEGSDTMPKQTNLAELGWLCCPTSLQAPSCVFGLFTLSELGEAATVVGLGESNWETSTAKHACFSGRSDLESKSFQRFMLQETSEPALPKIRHRNSDLRMLMSSKMDHDSGHGGDVENGCAMLRNRPSVHCPTDPRSQASTL
jgi:hypothetical protein